MTSWISCPMSGAPSAVTSHIRGTTPARLRGSSPPRTARAHKTPRKCWTMKTARVPKGRRTQRAVMRWADQQLARDPALARRVEALLTETRIEQDLVALRQARGMSPSHLAKLLHVTQPRTAKIESGDVKNLKLKTLVRYAAALGARVKVEFPNGASHAASRRAQGRVR